MVAVQALSEEQLAAEFPLGPLGHLDLVALEWSPGARRPDRQDILLNGQLDRRCIDARHVEMDLELVASAVGIDRDLSSSACGQQLLGDPVELAERFESHQHDGSPSLTVEQLAVSDRRASMSGTQSTPVT